MTRITFDWLTFFVGGGILLLASGESTVSAIAEQTTPNTKDHSLLTVTVTSSQSVDDSPTSYSEDNGLKSNHSMDDGESSNHSSTHTSEDTDDITSTQSTDSSTAEDAMDKASLQRSETKTDLKLSDLSNEVTNAIQNESHTSLMNSDTYLSTSEANTAPVDKKEQADNANDIPELSTTDKTAENTLNEQSTEKLSSKTESKITKTDAVDMLSTSPHASTKDYSEPNSKLNSENADGTTTGSSDVYAAEDSTVVEMFENPVTVETKSSLSSKSATRKRSINSTVTTTASDESLPTSILFSSPSPQGATDDIISDNAEMSTLLNAEVASENDSISTKSSGRTLPPDGMETTELTQALPLVYPHITELETEDSQGMDRKTENSVEMVTEFDHTDSRPGSKTGGIILANASEDALFSTTNVARDTREKYSTLLSSSTLMPSNDVSYVENGDAIEHEVTFDPDGMKKDGPQDPDSVIISVSSQDPIKTTTPQAVEYSTHTKLSGESADSATEAERESNPGEAVVNRTDDVDGKVEREPLSSHVAFASAVDEEPPFVSSTLNTVSSYTTANPSENPESQQTGVSSSTHRRAETNYGDFEMLQDSPLVHSSDHNQSKSGEFMVTGIDTKTTNAEISSVTPQAASSSRLVPEVPLATEVTAVEASSSFVVHQTEQSVIRPVKIKIASPSDFSASTSNLPASAAEFSPSPSAPTTGSPETTDRVETNPTDASSPMILPNPAPSTTEKGNGALELSTLLPELSSAANNKAVATETTSFNAGANSTIAGVAVKTSVSVSLPLSNAKNVSGSTLPSAFEDLLKNSSIVILPGNPPTIFVKTDNDSNTSAESKSDDLAVTTAAAETTTAGGFKIRKPKIKIPGGSDSYSRVARPFTPALKRPTTTAGPPVSIFNKSRTRGASITSSTTARPFRPLSTIRVHYASHIPGMVPSGELIISTEPVTEPPTTTEEYFSEEPFTDQTYTPSVSSEDDVTLIKVAGYIVLERGIRWNDQLSNRHSPEYKENAKMMHFHLERLFRSSSIAHRLWKIEIDGFSGNKKSRRVAVDFFLYLIKSHEDVSSDHLVSVLHEKLSPNNTFAKFRVDPSRTAFERLTEERMIKTTPSPEEETVEPPIPQWAIAVIVIGAASLIFIVLFAAVTMYGRHHMRRRYSSKLSEEDMERSSGEWESKMAAAYENMAADTIYDAEDLHSDTYKKSRIATFHGIPSTLKRCDSWSSNGWTTPPKRKRPHVH